MMGRKGDWLVAPFQCERCWFVNLHGRLPLYRVLGDERELALIRRVNLDLFWSRESDTLKSFISDARGMVQRAQAVGRPVPLPPMSPWGVEDAQGMGVCIQMLEKSLGQGRNDKTYTQFDTCRRLRATASNIFSATAMGCQEPLVLKSLKGHVMHMFKGPTQSRLIERFAMGMKARMPSKTKRNKPLTGALVKLILDIIEAEWCHAETLPVRKRLLCMCAGYIAVTYAYSLRGNEGFWVDAQRLVDGIETGKHPPNGVIPHVLVCLLGRFKNESGDRMHCFPIASETKSGVKVRFWLEQVVQVLVSERKTDCPAFCDSEGFLLSESVVESVFHPILEELKSSGCQHISKGIDVEENYHCFRSFRRGAEIQALNNGVSQVAIEFVHRWSKFEYNRGDQPSGFSMMEHYAEGEGTRPLQLEFSSNT